jgi:streptomycin 6-kinase
LDLPDEFMEKVHRVFGDKGRAWLPELPGIAAQCREKWQLPEGTICPMVSMNYIEFTVSPDGEPVALKIGVPHRDLFTEMETLHLYGGNGVVRLHDSDPDLGAILIQRLSPGTLLWELGDDRKQTEIAASIIRDLPLPVPQEHDLPTFSEWVRRAFRLTRTVWDPEERMPRSLIDRAEQAFDEVERVGGEHLQLHGDLHHENILFDDRLGWTVIDPKGVIGPHPLEIGRFLQNQLPDDQPIERRAEMVRNRLEIFGRILGCSQRLLVSAGLVDCVLGHCWSLEDESTGTNWERGIELGLAYCEMLDM